MEDTKQEVTRRTTILLRQEDVDNLKAISSETGTSDTESIRRALRLMNELLAWERGEGGQIILEKGRRRERIRFL